MPRSTRGVGPAERTGKSRSRYWPGGRRPGSPSSACRRRKPREIGAMGREPTRRDRARTARRARRRRPCARPLPTSTARARPHQPGARGRAHVLGRREPRDERRGEVAHGAVAHLEREPRPRLLGHVRRQRARDLGQPGVRRAHRQDPAGRRLGGDHPERLRERRGHDLRLAGRQQVGELLVLEPPGQHAALRQPRGRREVRLAVRRRPDLLEEGVQVVQRPPLAAAPGELLRPLQVAGGQQRQQLQQAVAELPEAHDHELRPRLGGEHERERRGEQVDALRREQLADEGDEPVLARVQARERERRRGVVAREAVALPGLLDAAARRGAPRGRAGRPRPPRGRRGPELARRRRPAARGACAPADSGRPSPPTGSRPCGASRRARRAPSPGPPSPTARSARCPASPCTRARCRGSSPRRGRRRARGRGSPGP